MMGPRTATLDNQIMEICQRAIQQRVFPGCVVGYIRNGHKSIIAHGRFGYGPDFPRVQESTAYDVASITKSIPTNSVILRLVEDGKISLDDQAARYLPEIQNSYREQITIRHLLTYTVVLNLGRGLSAVAKEGADTLMHTLFSAPLQAPPGQSYYYTNAPAIFLGLIAERVTGKSLDVLANDMFFEPLGMKQTTFHGERFSELEVAPTEQDTIRGVVQGQPHDEGAWTLRQIGIVAGNAGLFSTATDMLTYLNMILYEGGLGGYRYFSSEMIKQMYTNQIPELNASVGLGWETEWARMPGAPGGDKMFGKTGFTGCAIVANPETKTALVYLSNRTFPHRPASKAPIQAFRRELMEAVFSA